MKKVHSYDIVGDIIILNRIPKEINERELGKELLKEHKHIKSVFKKIEKYHGKYRVPKLKLIAGENKKETIHRENGSILKLDVEKCYFSVRSANERLRIANLVKKNEKVLVMFSGVGPFPILISKKGKSREIYGIELNKLAHKYALENLELNKAYNIKFYCGDVNKVMPKLNIKFDRIVMPLPTNADKFLGLARKYTKKNGIIHFYAFVGKEDKIINIIKNKLKKFKISNKVKCGYYAPGVNRMCFDIKVS